MIFFRKNRQREDRREYVRLEKKFRTKYGIIELDEKIPIQYDMLDSVELKYNGHTKNICEAGLCLENGDLKDLLKTSIKEGTELKLRISVPCENPGDINSVGKVVWADLERGVCGLEFKSIFYDDRLKIREYIRDEYFKKRYKRWAVGVFGDITEMNKMPKEEQIIKEEASNFPTDQILWGFLPNRVIKINNEILDKISKEGYIRMENPSIFVNGLIYLKKGDNRMIYDIEKHKIIREYKMGCNK